MKSRVILLLVLHALILLPVAAQDAMPTKEETVNYLKKKLMEVDGLKQTKDGPPLKGYLINLNNGKIEFTQQGGGVVYGWMYSFDPAHILDVKIYPVRHWEMDAMEVVFVSKLVVRQAVKPTGGLDYSRSKETVLSFQFPFIRTPGNGEKIRKAFLHLRDLAKAEDDIFSN
jgi:hypothetical protein